MDRLRPVKHLQQQLMCDRRSARSRPEATLQLRAATVPLFWLPAAPPQLKAAGQEVGRIEEVQSELRCNCVRPLFASPSPGHWAAFRPIWQLWANIGQKRPERRAEEMKMKNSVRLAALDTLPSKAEPLPEGKKYSFAHKLIGLWVESAPMEQPTLAGRPVSCCCCSKATFGNFWATFQLSSFLCPH